MSRAGIAWAGLAVAAVAVAAFAVRSSSTVENRPASTSRMVGSDPTTATATAPLSPPAVTSRPSSAADGARPTRRPPIPRDQRAPAVYSPDPDDDRPLVGLRYRSTTDAERKRLAVPDRFGRGVIITSIHPDAPAVLSGSRHRRRDPSRGSHRRPRGGGS